MPNIGGISTMVKSMVMGGKTTEGGKAYVGTVLTARLLRSLLACFITLFSDDTMIISC